MLLEPEIQKEIVERSMASLLTSRLLDIFFAVTILILFAPLWIVMTLLIRIDSKGPVIFKQQRVGKDGKVFSLYKFRTMYEYAKEQEYAPTSPDDPRITKRGRFLRRTSFDEIPQCINILKGEMSLIGPRPEMEFLVKKYTPLERTRLLIKPGLTGLWQIYGRKDIPLYNNMEYDFFYLLHRSLWLDLVILGKTMGVIVMGKGAY